MGEIIQRFRYLRNTHKRKCVKVLNWQESIEKIKSRNYSLARFGDGEMLIVFQYLGLTQSKSTFQDYDQKLGQRLYDIIHKPVTSNILIGLPHCMFGRGVSDMKFGAKYFWERFSSNWIDTIINILPNCGQEYADTNMTRFYNDFKNNKQANLQINLIKTLWSGRDVIIVEGSKTRFGVGNDLFENTKSIRRILIPPTNAFDVYDVILNEIKQAYNPGDLILMAAGMTATVLAFDLSKFGIQSLDIGHLDIEYEWLRMGAKERIKVPGKFTNESSDRDNVECVYDRGYLSQVIKEIKHNVS